MKLGIGSYTYTWAAGVPGSLPQRPMSALDLLAQAVELGVRVVQFCDNLPLTALPEASLVELAQLASRHRREVEIGTRGLNTDNLLAHLQLAKRFGSTFVRLVIDSPGDEPSPIEATARLDELLPEFRRAGVKLALENHDRFTARDFVDIVEKLGPSDVGICLDTVNSFGALEGPEVVVGLLAPYTLNLHVKDFTISRVSSKMGFVISGCAAGQGRLNIPWLLDQLCAHHREVNAIIELWTPPGATVDETIRQEKAWASESVRYLRKLIAD